MTGIRNLFQIAERPPLLSGLLATITCLAAGTPVSGAERIQFFYGPFEPTIYVTELEAVAQGDFTDIGGVLSSQLTEHQLQALQAALNYRLEVDLPTLTRLTSSAVGQKLLLRIGQVVQTDNLLNSSNAISAALILAAAQERDLTLLAIVKHFPLETIQLNLPLLIRLLEENEQLFQRQGDVVQTIQQQAAAQSANVVLAESLDLSLAGPHRWEVETFSFQTPGRPTSAPADLYLPETANSSVPVVVISHGMASDRTSFVYLAEHLASHGFAVIVPEHIDN